MVERAGGQAEYSCIANTGCDRSLLPPIVCVCGGPATRGTENAYRGGCTVDTTTGGRAYVTCTTLRPRRPDGRRSRRRDRLLRGAGPRGRGQDVRRGRVLCKKGHKYLVVVVDHDSGRLVWAAPGRDKKTVHAFSGALGAERSAALTHVSADGAGFIAGVVTQRAPPQSSAPTPFMPASWLCRCCRCQAVQGR